MPMGMMEEEEIDPITGQPVAAAAQEAPAPMNPVMDPVVKDHIMKKFNLGEYSDENRKKVIDDNSGYDFRGSLGAALTALGGGDGQSVLKNRNAERQSKIDQFDKGRANKIQDYSLDRQVGKDSREDMVNASNDDVKSEMSLTKQALARKMAPEIDWSGKSGAQIEQVLPSITKLYEMDQRQLDRQEARDERRYLHNVNREDKREARAQKAEELSVPKAKQKGLYESGLLSEKQYQEATKNKDDYDPTSVGQIIDNSDWAPNVLKNNSAIKARAAERAWVESFLRDASGAAIPESERGAYAKDFFPQPGDPEDVVKNKKALREQKMANAALGGGIKHVADLGDGDPEAKARRERIAELKAKQQGRKAGR